MQEAGGLALTEAERVRLEQLLAQDEDHSETEVGSRQYYHREPLAGSLDKRHLYLVLHETVLSPIYDSTHGCRRAPLCRYRAMVSLSLLLLRQHSDTLTCKLL